jgi:hypothetical protein
VSDAAFGWNDQASSASFFSLADMPLSPAFRLYDAFSAAVQRKSTLADALSLAGKGGLPPFRFGLSMAGKCTHENNP